MHPFSTAAKKWHGVLSITPKPFCMDDNNQNSHPDGGYSEKRPESDAERVIHRHLENQDDIITDDDIRNIRVGVAPSDMDEATRARFEDSGEVEGLEDRMADEPNADQGPNGKASSANPITPWDIKKD
jgi:hypothetical protein